jgi:ATP-binding protein involved in chromosome partitioning
MKDYFDLNGDGGSDVMGQVIALRKAIKQNLSSVNHLVAVGSGKGGVGKSTLTMQIAAALRRRKCAVACLDADFNGPSLARLAGLRDAPLLPGRHGLVLPKSSTGIGILSLGSVVPETEAVDFASVASGDSHVWRATKEFAMLAQFLATTEWGTLDYLLIDLPPGAERCFQFAEFLGHGTEFVLVTIPSEVSHGVVSRSITALGKAKASIIGLIENMGGYVCSGCHTVRPLFPPTNTDPARIPFLGSIPFDPELARRCDAGEALLPHDDSPVTKAIDAAVDNILSTLNERIAV